MRASSLEVYQRKPVHPTINNSLRCNTLHGQLISFLASTTDEDRALIKKTPTARITPPVLSRLNVLQRCLSHCDSFLSLLGTPDLPSGSSQRPRAALASKSHLTQRSSACEPLAELRPNGCCPWGSAPESFVLNPIKLFASRYWGAASERCPCLRVRPANTASRRRSTHGPTTPRRDMHTPLSSVPSRPVRSKPPPMG